MSDLIWSVYVQLSYNAYGDVAPAGGLTDDLAPDLLPSPRLLWDPALWDDLIGWTVDAGANQLVRTLGDGILYELHPEIAVEGAWTPGELRREIVRLNELGLEVVPELNFSTTHDLWLGPCHWMISTPDYYRVCADLIA